MLAQSGGELHFCLRSEPKTFNPLLAADDASETVRYLTGGVLVRVNRLTQDLEPELATSWKVTNGGKTITFQLRDGLRFSDGTPFSADDVALHHAATHGSGVAFADRRCVPFVGGQSGNRGSAEEPCPHHVPGADRRPRQAFRSGGDHVRQVATKRDGGARTLLRLARTKPDRI